ncbi:MAG: prolyl oligopeptidase family serine peptidase [Hyphomonas sp.]|nr:prolyl oligopeptidase family serine peptidase [Hyphomonas sp.]
MTIQHLGTQFVRAVVAASLACAGICHPGTAAADPVPIEAWAIREVMQGVQINPSGSQIAWLSNPTREGNPILQIYETGKFSEKPVNVGADHMELQGFSWVNDTKLIISFRQKVRKRIDGFNRGVYENKLAMFDVPTKEFTELGNNFSIASFLPTEPDSIIISQANDRFGLNLEDDPFAAFRPRTYFKLNLETGRKELILKGNSRVATAIFDDAGYPRFSSGYDAGTREFVFYARNRGETDWREVGRLDSYALESSNFNVEAFDPDNDDIAFVSANNGDDKVGIWKFNIRTGEFEDLVYRRTDVDVAGMKMTSNFWSEGNRPVGILYYGAKYETEWIDPEEKALYESLQQAIPNAHQLTVSSRSRDGNTMVVYNAGPKDPGSYYLLQNGSLSFVGSKNPLLKPEDLSEVRYIKYPTRDGREVAGYLTVPKGDEPHPLIVLPHGGPFVSEVVGFDEWAQFLANNGYAVLQPQYRGSLGYGLEHWRIAYGQGGLKMQDDKDDGALWLVEQGFADKDRLAMFGWSYGGYAAAVAASREPNIYQCTIAGAAVVDGNMQLNYYRDGLLPATEYWELKRREGVQPLDEVGKVNIPLMVIHGDVDQRVPFEHYKKYTQALKKAGIDHKSVVLKGADHFYNTLFFDHQETLYREMLDFLQNDCGPGGL